MAAGNLSMSGKFATVESDSTSRSVTYGGGENYLEVANVGAKPVTVGPATITQTDPNVPVQTDGEYILNAGEKVIMQKVFWHRCKTAETTSLSVRVIQ